MENNQSDLFFMIQQLARRQEQSDKQVEQAIQQAMAALRQAQELVRANTNFSNGLHASVESGRLDPGAITVSDVSLTDGQLPGWLRARPPDLQ